MAFVVPYDGLKLSRAALIRAAQFATVLEEDVIAVTVIPRNNADYARERGWIDDDEPFDLEAIVTHLRRDVARLAPEATFEFVVTDRYAPAGTIAAEIRGFAREHDASLVFVGSENAGRVVRSITVGQSVATDRSYDTMIVSHPRPVEIEALEDVDVPVESVE